MGAADQSADPEKAPDAQAGENEIRHVDRSHNRDTLSSEAMTEMLRDLQDTLLALDERLGTLEAAHGHSNAQTRKLAVGVAQLGDALTRRIQALEEAKAAPAATPPEPEPALFLAPPAKPVRRPPESPVAISVGLAFVLLLILGTLWFWRSEIMDHMRPAAPPPAAVTAPPAPVNAPAAQPPKPATATIHPASHQSAARHAENDASLDEQRPASSTQTVDKPPPSFVLYSQNASTASH